MLLLFKDFATYTFLSVFMDAVERLAIGAFNVSQVVRDFNTGLQRALSAIEAATPTQSLQREDHIVTDFFAAWREVGEVSAAQLRPAFKGFFLVDAGRKTQGRSYFGARAGAKTLCDFLWL